AVLPRRLRGDPGAVPGGDGQGPEPFLPPGTGQALRPDDRRRRPEAFSGGERDLGGSSDVLPETVRVAGGKTPGASLSVADGGGVGTRLSRRRVGLIALSFR